MYYSVLAYEATEEDTHPEVAEQPPAAALAWVKDHENRELVRTIAGQGEEAVAAFTLLYHRYQLPVFAFCARVLGDRGHAQDVTQEVLYTVWKNAATYRGQAQVKTWVLGIAHNLCRNLWRKERPERGMPSAADHRSLAGRSFDNENGHPWPHFRVIPSVDVLMPLQRVRNKEQQHLLREGLSKLSPVQRTVLHLAYFEGLSIHEIAQVLGICAGTVKSRMANARRLLRHYLEHVGIH